MRINARLEDGYTTKLTYLVRTTGLSISAIIKQAIVHLYDHIRLTKIKSSNLLEKTGFIGGFHGPANLSTNYKEEFLETLKSKHGHR